MRRKPCASPLGRPFQTRRAGTPPGGGVPGVLSSARLLDRLVPAATSSPTTTGTPAGFAVPG
ncbi:MAG: hypothetical protein FIB01_00940 [Gemmatimonadetes bacterium]|nr:hypothetical protein [Gemmatimonadota bacterium]